MTNHCLQVSCFYKQIIQYKHRRTKLKNSPENGRYILLSSLQKTKFSSGNLTCNAGTYIAFCIFSYRTEQRPITGYKKWMGMPMDISILKKELETSQARIIFLEKENSELRQEVSRLRAQVNALKAHDVERKSILWKKLQSSMETNKIADRSPQKHSSAMENSELKSASQKKLDQKEDLVKLAAKREMPAKPAGTVTNGDNLQGKLATPQPSAPPPPPPPLPSKLLARSKSLRRVPEVLEFYRALMKRDAQKDTRTGAAAPSHPILNNMIGEIENRSSYLLNIKSDVKNQRELVNFLTKQVQAAAFADISEVETFVKWLDGQLSCLVDERAVLKYFPQWPERKADALREAACSYREIKNLESEVMSYKDNPKQQLAESLRKMQALQERLEKSIHNVERVREGTSKKYRELHIPWSWLQDTGVIGQLKFASVKLAEQYMRMITREMESSDPSQAEDHLILGVRFAHRVHQFAGGFDADALLAFEELRRVGQSAENSIPLVTK